MSDSLEKWERFVEDYKKRPDYEERQVSREFYRFGETVAERMERERLERLAKIPLYRQIKLPFDTDAELPS